MLRSLIFYCKVYVIMKVCFDTSLWHRGKGRRGRRQAAGWNFEYAGMRCVIPAVYRFPRGIVFDILSFADEAELTEYINRYESVEEKLTPSERRCAEQENPFKTISLQEIWLNKTQRLGDISYSYAVSVPRAGQHESLKPLRRAYRRYIGNNQPFACQRVRASYQQSASRRERLLRLLLPVSMKSMRLSVSAMQWFYPLNIRFELPESAGTQIELTDPATKKTHTLYIGKAETTKLPITQGMTRRLHAALAAYEIDPELPEGSSLVFNSSIETGGAVGPEDFLANEEPGAAAIGIIGGADGPTAIFVGTKENRQPIGPHGLPLHMCFSQPSFTETETNAFYIEGLSATRIGETVITLGNEQ
jgi:hypothetical protein